VGGSSDQVFSVRVRVFPRRNQEASIDKKQGRQEGDSSSRGKGAGVTSVHIQIRPEVLQRDPGETRGEGGESLLGIRTSEPVF